MSEWLSECDDVMEATTGWEPGNWGKGGSEEILTLIRKRDLRLGESIYEPLLGQAGEVFCKTG